MMSSIHVLKGVKPTPSWKQAGSRPVTISKNNEMESRENPARVFPIEAERYSKTGIMQSAKISKNLPATQNWVAVFAPRPGKTHIPL